MLRLLVLPRVRPLCWMMTGVRLRWVMYFVLLPPVSPLAPGVSVGEGVVGGVLFGVLSVELLVWVLQSLVLGLGLGVVGSWVLLGVGPRHSCLRARWVALLVGLPVRPSGVSGGLSPLVAEGPGRRFLSFLCGVRCSG